MAYQNRVVGQFDVTVGAGRLRSSATEAVSFPHGWTEDGVMVEAAFTGAHLLYLAAAGCVLRPAPHSDAAEAAHLPCTWTAPAV
jgi:hypothetical protein